MNSLYVDLIVLAVIALSALFAFIRGFLREILSIGAWIVAGFAAWFGWPLLLPYVGKLPYVGQYLDDHELVAIAASAGAIFVVVLVVVTIISHSLTRGVRESALGPLDRSLGLLFGVLRGALIVCVLLMITDSFFDKNQPPDWIMQARSHTIVRAGADAIYEMLPDWLLKQGESTADAAKAQVQQAVEMDQTIHILTGAGQNDTADSAASAGDSGYKDAERNDLDRLIQGTQ